MTPLDPYWRGGTVRTWGKGGRLYTILLGEADGSSEMRKVTGGQSAGYCTVYTY